jgi:predicted DNA-binding transcriptional regulator YafY
VFRDLELLEQAGLPFEYDRVTKRYSGSRDAFLPAVSVSQGEALAIMLAARYLLSRNIFPDSEAAVSAGKKVESILPRELRETCEVLADKITIRETAPAYPGVIAQTLPTLQWALGQRKKVRIVYNSFYDRTLIETHVRPYHLAFLGKSWYLIGWCDELSRVRTFKVGRMKEVNVLDDTYRLDPNFSLDAYLGNAWTMIRGGPSVRRASQVLFKGRWKRRRNNLASHSAHGPVIRRRINVRS